MQMFFKCQNYNSKVDCNISQWCVLLILFKYKRDLHQRHWNTAAIIIISYLWKYHFHTGERVRRLWLWGELVMGFWTILWTSITGWHWGERCCSPHQSLAPSCPYHFSTGHVHALSKSESSSLMTVMAEDGSVNGGRKREILLLFRISNETAR